uniref:uncharacterized protein n=1 Tax=Myxine glutinosa TaxID=7769 RepID=UPI00358EDED9
MTLQIASGQSFFENNNIPEGSFPSQSQVSTIDDDKGIVQNRSFVVANRTDQNMENLKDVIYKICDMPGKNECADDDTCSNNQEGSRILEDERFDIVNDQTGHEADTKEKKHLKYTGRLKSKIETDETEERQGFDVTDMDADIGGSNKVNGSVNELSTACFCLWIRCNSGIDNSVQASQGRSPHRVQEQPWSRTSIPAIVIEEASTVTENSSTVTDVPQESISKVSGWQAFRHSFLCFKFCRRRRASGTSISTISLPPMSSLKLKSSDEKLVECPSGSRGVFLLRRGCRSRPLPFSKWFGGCRGEREVESQVELTAREMRELEDALHERARHLVQEVIEGAKAIVLAEQQELQQKKKIFQGEEII